MTGNGILYTHHGKKKPQGELAMVNKKAALAYVQGSGKDKAIVGYTYLDEIIDKVCRSELPSYVVKF